MVTIKLHGDLGKNIGENWNLNVSSVSEAIRAIESSTKKLYKYLYEKDKDGAKYRLLINNEPFKTDEELDIKKPDSILNSELRINRKKLERIDVVPVLEGADSKIFGIFTLIVGIILIATGVGSPGGIALLSMNISAGSLIIAGVALAAAGAMALLSQPPDFKDFREIDNGGRTSYLFSGPSNILGEGGPVPVGYGRLIIGSQVISASYAILQFNTDDKSEILRNVNLLDPLNPNLGNLSWLIPN